MVDFCHLNQGTFVNYVRRNYLALVIFSLAPCVGSWIWVVVCAQFLSPLRLASYFLLSAYYMAHAAMHPDRHVDMHNGYVGGYFYTSLIKIINISYSSSAVQSFILSSILS